MPTMPRMHHAALLLLCATLATAKAPKKMSELVYGVEQIRTPDQITKQPRRHYFVAYYMAECGFCKAMAWEWAKLGLSGHDGTKLAFGKVDATVYKDERVKGYPTILLYKADGEIVEYTNHRHRDFEHFAEFIKEQTGLELVRNDGYEKIIENADKHNDFYDSVPEAYHPDTDEHNDVDLMFYAWKPVENEPSEVMTFNEVKEKILDKHYIRTSIMALAGDTIWNHATDLPPLLNLFGWVDKLEGKTKVKILPKYKPVSDTRQHSDHLVHFTKENENLMNDGRYWLIAITRPGHKHCYEFSKKLKAVADELGPEHKRFAVGNICTRDQEELSEKYDVPHLPYAFIHTPTKKVVEYDPHSVETLLAFLHRVRRQEEGTDEL
eukprot:TRINITY_DN43933_c0_g1_i1.p1 TRINITY_DN43933_c0_g1~~TRINITY_DN43933_c0_g1_i1.p1  ORF type:complete len:380 (+),score=158.00 TRINITY_DN43933_c0_g1_i1:78-1217(+)